MPNRDNTSRSKHAQLFLLRVWCDDADANGDEQADEDGDEGEKSGLKGPWQRQWHGRVQRTVSGETQSFDGIEGLIEVLAAMLYKDRQDQPGHSRPPGTSSSEAATPASGNNQTGANETKEGTC
jgi:hypothetical protein